MDGSAEHFARNDVPRCGVCRDVIGVYEPLVRVLDGSVYETSRAAEPHLEDAGEPWYHRSCYRERCGLVRDGM
jgi:hypothetical protein